MSLAAPSSVVGGQFLQQQQQNRLQSQNNSLLHVPKLSSPSEFVFPVIRVPAVSAVRPKRPRPRSACLDNTYLLRLVKTLFSIVFANLNVFAIIWVTQMALYHIYEEVVCVCWLSLLDIPFALLITCDEVWLVDTSASLLRRASVWRWKVGDNFQASLSCLHTCPFQ